MSEILLKVQSADYARLVSRRRKAAFLLFLVCGAVATAIIVAEYRLMLISFVVMFPALIAVLDAVMVSRSARTMGACDVQCDGEWLTLNPIARFRVDTITMVRVQPDAVTLVELVAPQKWRSHLLAIEGAAQEPLLTKLKSLGRKVQIEKATLAMLTAFIWGVMANLVLDAVAGVLVLGALVYTVKGFINGPGPGWEAAACFGGAVLSLTAKALLHAFVLKVPRAD